MKTGGADGSGFADPGLTSAAQHEADDRVRVERRAAELAARLEVTFESITDALFTLDTEWRLTHVNRRAEELFGIERADLLGRTLTEAAPAVVGTPFDDAYRRAVETGERQVARAYEPSRDRTFEANAFPFDDGLTVWVRDVTDEVRTQALLEEQNLLLDRARDAILARTLDHRVTYWNRGAARLYGWTADEALGHDVRELLHDDPTEFDRAMERVLTEGEWWGECRHRTRAGREVTVEASWTLIRDERGGPGVVVAIYTDATDRARFHQQLLRTQRLESIGTFAGGVAHDINNVLAPILLAVQLLAVDEADDAKREILASIEASTQRGAELVRRVLSFARGMEGGGADVDVGELVRDVAQIAVETFPRHVELRVEGDDPGVTVRGDPTQLRQVLLGLCVNARDAMPNGGMLTLSSAVMVVPDPAAATGSIEPPGRQVALQVSDTGTGMPRAVLERIFDPFFTTKGPGGGAGLGLPAALAIVEAHGGQLRAESTPGTGSTFTVLLPLDAPDEPPPAAVVFPPR